MKTHQNSVHQEADSPLVDRARPARVPRPQVDVGEAKGRLEPLIGGDATRPHRQLLVGVTPADHRRRRIWCVAPSGLEIPKPSFKVDRGFREAATARAVHVVGCGCGHEDSFFHLPRNFLSKDGVIARTHLVRLRPRWSWLQRWRPPWSIVISNAAQSIGALIPVRPPFQPLGGNR